MTLFDLTLDQLVEVEAVLGGPYGLLFDDQPASVAKTRAGAFIQALSDDPDLKAEAWLESSGGFQPFLSLAQIETEAEAEVEADD